MSLFLALAVVVAFVLFIGMAVLISIGRAASLDHSPAMALVLERKTPSARGRRHVM